MPGLTRYPLEPLRFLFLKNKNIHDNKLYKTYENSQLLYSKIYMILIS